VLAISKDPNIYAMMHEFHNEVVKRRKVIRVIQFMLLVFENWSNSEEHSFYADAIADEIITQFNLSDKFYGIIQHYAS